MFRQYLGKSHASHPLIVKEPHTLPRRRTESIGGRGRQLLFAGSLLLAAQVHVGTFTAFAYTAGLIVFICKSSISLLHDNLIVSLIAVKWRDQCQIWKL